MCRMADGQLCTDRLLASLFVLWPIMYRQAASHFIVCVMTLSHPLYITVLNQQYCSVYRLLATSLFVL